MANEMMAAEGQAPAEGGGGGAEELVMGVGRGMTLVAGLLEKSGAPQEAMAKMQEVMAGFQEVVKILGGAGGQEQAPQGASPMQAPEGIPAGPAGV